MLKIGQTDEGFVLQYSYVVYNSGSSNTYSVFCTHWYTTDMRFFRKKMLNISNLDYTTRLKLKVFHYTPRRRLGEEEVYLLLILDNGTAWG
jgi:hypothetical protein